VERPNQEGVLVANPAISYAPYANDPRDDHIVNAKLVWQGNKAVLVATMDIAPSEEIFVDYGLDYWRTRLHLLDPEARADTAARIRDLFGHPSTQAEDSNVPPTPCVDIERASPTSPILPEDDDPLATLNSGVTWTSSDSVSQLCHWTSCFFPHLHIEETEVTSMLNAAYELGSSIFDASHAVQWADGFNIPDSAVAADRTLWHSSERSLAQMIEHKRNEVHSSRITVQRAEANLSVNNPHRSAVIDLVRQGIQLCTPPSYTGCGWPGRPALGKGFLEAAPAVEKMMYEAYWQKGLGILLSAEEVSSLDSLGLCIASWTGKLGKECGRPITNGSGRRTIPAAQYINGPEAKALAIALYGAIDLPTIGDIVRLIMAEAARRGVPLSRLRIWAFDIEAAYAKLSYDPEGVPHIAVELRNNLFMFFLAGVFGLTSMPFAFNVITRAIVWELNNRILAGAMKQYVDDGFGTSLDTEVEDDIAATQTFINALLGEGAFACHKLLRGPQITFIGYDIDLDAATVSISKRNILKGIFAFSNTDLSPEAVVPVKHLQKLASLASRYGAICRTMKPFVRTLYAAYAGRADATSVGLSSVCRAVIRMFRNMFAVLGLRPLQFARPLSSFVKHPHRWVCEFDASLSGIGIMWFQVDSQGREVAEAYTSVDITPLHFGDDASFQNTDEYIASLLCVRGLAALGGSDQPVLFRGDSVSALTWIEKGSVHSGRALRAAVMWAQYVVTYGVIIADTVHLAARVNTRADILSRQGSWSDVIQEDQRAYGGHLSPTLTRLQLREEPLLRLVDPKLPLDSEEDFNHFFADSLIFLADHLADTHVSKRMRTGAPAPARRRGGGRKGGKQRPHDHTTCTAPYHPNPPLSERLHVVDPPLIVAQCTTTPQQFIGPPPHPTLGLAPTRRGYQRRRCTSSTTRPPLPPQQNHWPDSHLKTNPLPLLSWKIASASPPPQLSIPRAPPTPRYPKPCPLRNLCCTDSPPRQAHSPTSPPKNDPTHSTSTNRALQRAPCAPTRRLGTSGLTFSRSAPGDRRHYRTPSCVPLPTQTDTPSSPYGRSGYSRP
jgi:hypothetical protein